MEDMIKVSFTSEQKPFVLGRDLHATLRIETPYHKWFPRMCEYGFEDNRDFRTFLSESSGGRPGMDHQLSIEMAKEICMIQRTELGKKCREYFLELERRWNSPETIMARALQFANRQLTLVQEQNALLQETNAVQAQQIRELKPKASYYDVVLSCKDLLSITRIAKDYNLAYCQHLRASL
jgi:anti-repressor protein